MQIVQQPQQPGGNPPLILQPVVQQDTGVQPQQVILVQQQQPAILVPVKNVLVQQDGQPQAVLPQTASPAPPVVQQNAGVHQKVPGDSPVNIGGHAQESAGVVQSPGVAPPRRVEDGDANKQQQEKLYQMQDAGGGSQEKLDAQNHRNSERGGGAGVPQRNDNVPHESQHIANNEQRSNPNALNSNKHNVKNFDDAKDIERAHDSRIVEDRPVKHADNSHKYDHNDRTKHDSDAHHRVPSANAGHRDHYVEEERRAAQHPKNVARSKFVNDAG